MTHGYKNTPGRTPPERLTSLSQGTPPTQHTTNTPDDNPSHQQDSNPQPLCLRPLGHSDRLRTNVCNPLLYKFPLPAFEPTEFLKSATLRIVQAFPADICTILQSRWVQQAASR